MGPGLYLHIPFCQHHCGYCNFAVMTGADDAFRTRYSAALKLDLSAVADGGPGAVAPPGADVAPEWPTFTSVFVGGGTPTLLAPSDLAGLLRHAREALPVVDDAEVTSEANPDGLTAEGLSELVAAGLTRLSIGAQSFAPGVLSFLDRRHDREAPLRAVAAARAAGVAQVSLDLIYGAPAETARDWAASLRTALAARPDHVSAYALTLEANTPYAARVRGGAQAAPDDDVAAERMAVAGEVLGAAGFERYETSNWARPGARCRHNLTYWGGGDYLGVGAGAHGHWQGRRWWSTRPPARYADAALAGGSTTAGSEILDDATRRVERLMLGLRLVGGVDRAAVDPVDETALRELVSAGLLDEDPDRLVLTAAGRPLADGVTLRLLPG